MIIKSMSRKSVSFGQLLSYMNKDQAKENPAILHNLKTHKDDLKQIEKELLENFRYTKIRKNGVVLYHEILSFSEKDRFNVTLEILEDLGRQYLEMRASNALAYAKAHFDTDNPHLHILVTGNEIQSKKKLRISQQQFRKIKKDLERYQREKYPELTHSLCQTNFKKKGGVRRTSGERERQRRLKKPNQKDLVFEKISSLIARSENKEDFEEILERSGFRFYLRGKTCGVQDVKTEKKYRLKTLGLDKDFQIAQERWKRFSVRTREIEKIRTTKAVHRLKEMSFQEDIFEVLHADPNSDLQLRSIRKRKRQRRRGMSRY